MSSEVKRHAGLDGREYVALDDYAALEAENARLVREAKNDAIAYKAVLERQDELRAERDAARAQLAAIQGGMGEEVEVRAVVLTEGQMGVGYDRRVGPVIWLGSPPPGEQLMTVAQHQRITAAMAAEVERLSDRNESLEQQAAHNYEVARLAAEQTSALRAELAAVKGQEAVPVLAAYECCHCGAKTGAPKPFSAFVVCPGCGEKTAATRAARYAPASPDVEGLVKVLEEAITDIEDWAAYASPYFQEKHDLAGCLERHRAALSSWRQSHP